MVYTGNQYSLETRDLHHLRKATGALPVSRGSEDAGRLPVQVLETQANKQTQRTSVLQMGTSLKERVRERNKKKRERERRGDQASSVSEAQLLLFSKGTFIPQLVYRGK